MSADPQRPPDEEALEAFSGGLDASQPEASSLTLAALPLGARLILRCRKDWRDATIVSISIEKITLSVGAPSGRTYRVRRPPDTPLFFDGSIPLVGATNTWRAGFARYDTRW